MRRLGFVWPTLKQMLFSVIIPTFNRAAFIEATMRSVFAQTCTDFEVIVVDDCSTDGTLAVLENFKDSVRVLTQPNSGPGVARNLGMAGAQGRYLAFLDSDDLWFPWTLETFRRLIEKHDPAIISGRPFMFEREGELESVVEEPVRVEVFSDYFAADPATVLPGAGLMVVKADALRAAGGFTAARVYGEDTECYMRLGTAPGLVVVRAPFTLGYRRHAGSAMMNSAKIVQGRFLMLSEERAGRYPGGAARRGERLALLAHHCRFPAVNAVYDRQFKPALDLYKATLGLNLRAGRLRYVLGFPFLALGVRLSLLKPPRSMHGVSRVPAIGAATKQAG